MRRTLIIMAVALTAVAFLAAETDLWDGHRSFRDVHFHSTGLRSFRVSHRGEITLDESQSSIAWMSPDASLEVSERRFFTRRRLEVHPDSSGRPRYQLEVGGRKRSEDEAREFLGVVMEDVVRSTTIGSHARARRLLEEDGLDGLLRETGHLDSNAARRIYLEVAAAGEELTEEDARRIIRTAGREMTSSSRLRSTLTYLAEEFSAEWALTGAFAEASESIASSSEKGRTLVELTRLRGLEAADAGAVADALETIASSGEMSRAIQRVARLAPSPEIIEALLEPIRAIASSGDRRRALDDLSSYPGLAESAYRRALDLGADIASSGEKASFLSDLTAVLPPSEALQQRYIEVAGDIASSSEQARALTALLRASGLPDAVCVAWVEAAGGISSSSTVANLLSEAASRCPDSDAVWKAYLRAVREIPSSGEQRRALMALLDRDNLDQALLRDVSSLAKSAIASTGESQQVVKRTQALLAN